MVETTVSMPGGKLLAEARKRKAFTCIDCGRCTGVCPVARAGLGYSPRRLIQQATRDQMDVTLLDHALFACLACDRCAQVCNSGIRISGFMLELRAFAREQGATGRVAHAGVLHSLMRIMANSDSPQDRLGWVDSSLRTASQGDVLYFVGCAPYFDRFFAHLGVESLRTVRNAVRLLNAVGVEPTLMPDERCCGHDLLWSGDVENFKRLAERNLAQITRTGAKRMVFSCPECLRTFKLDYQDRFGGPDLELLHITEFLAERSAELALGQVSGRATFHDPCRLGRQLGVYEQPRRLLQSVPGLELIEMEHSRDAATCCGGGAWVECGTAVRSLQDARLAEASATGADLLVTACPKCDIHLRCARCGGTTPAAPRIVNLIDLLAESLGPVCPGGRPADAALAQKGEASDA